MALLAASIALGARARDLETTRFDVHFVSDSTQVGAGSETPFAVGDINGDGVADMVIGQPFAGNAAGAPTSSGLASIFFGPRVEGETLRVPEDADVTVRGAEESELGTSFVIADVSGDGHADLIVGARGPGSTSLPERPSGQVLVVFGPFTAGASIDLSVTPPDWRMEDIGNLTSGGPLAAGDLSGDGVADLVVGAQHGSDPLPPRRQQGEVHVVFGPLVRGETIHAGDRRTLVIRERYHPVAGYHVGFELGTSLAVGDVDANGQLDLVAGAPEAYGAGNVRKWGGEIAVFHGPLTPGLWDLETTPPTAVAWGEGPTGTFGFGETLGSSVALGDVTGDGSIDILAGAGGADARGDDNSGAAYVLAGPIARGDVIDVAAGEWHARILGARAGESWSLGPTLAAGNADGDPATEWAVASRFSRGPYGTRPEAGAIAFFCDALERGTTIDLARGDAEVVLHGRMGDHFGSAVFLADVSGDGLADVIGWSPSSTGPPGHRSAGQIAVLFGDPCNRVPHCNPGPAPAVECGTAPACGEGWSVPLDASQSYSVNGPLVEQDWTVTCPDDASTMAGASGDACARPRCGAPCVATFVARDVLGRSSSCSVEIPLVDEIPPVVEVSREPLATAWPPNHSTWSVEASLLAPAISDECSEPVRWRFGPCASSQQADARGTGDGHHAPDCIISDDGLSVTLRSERDGTDRSGRVYTLTAVATDACGNASAPVPVATVPVPHDRRR